MTRIGLISQTTCRCRFGCFGDLQTSVPKQTELLRSSPVDLSTSWTPYFGPDAQGITLVILVLSFPRILWVRQEEKILGNFEVFLGKLRAWEIDRKGKFPKVLRGGCKRSFGPREQRSPKSLLHHPKPHFAPEQKQFWVVPKTFRRPLLPGSKRPFAPSPKHFWEFSLFGQFPRPAASQGFPWKKTKLTPW